MYGYPDECSLTNPGSSQVASSNGYTQASER
jgi:hypothetical protein